MLALTLKILAIVILVAIALSALVAFARHLTTRHQSKATDHVMADQILNGSRGSFR